MDKRILILGAALLAIGGLAWLYLYSTAPVPTANMTDDQTASFNESLTVNSGLQNIAQMVAGIGFMLALISVGLKRRKKGGAGKTVTQKPVES